MVDQIGFTLCFIRLTHIYAWSLSVDSSRSEVWSNAVSFLRNGLRIRLIQGAKLLDEVLIN